MEIVIAAQGLPFGPDTIEHRSLGGSETAALQMAKEMRKRDHLVTIFCNLPQPGMPDHIPNGSQCELGVRWVDFEQFGPFIANTEIDLLVVSRNPDLFAGPHQAKKAVLWCHDLATYKGFMPRMMNAAWNFDEIWTVSEYHKKQIHDVTGYPLENMRATRNGIVRFDDLMALPRDDKHLLYSARPERGLENLVRPEGIMEKLPDFHLHVTMYENYPEQMMPYYKALWARCEELPNVTLHGPKTQMELRQMMTTMWAYAYPTAFEEVSCILARECMSEGLPFISTTIGALPETLDGAGILLDVTKDEVGSDKFIEDFAKLIRDTWDEYEAEANAEEGVGAWFGSSIISSARQDIYWDGVAAEWEAWAEPKEESAYTKIVSLVKDSDIIPAMALLNEQPNSPGIQWLRDQLHTCYPFLTGDCTFEEHYKQVYEFEEQKGAPERKKMMTLQGTNRYNSIAQEVAQLQDGSLVFDYGCAEGPILLGLAQDFPNLRFIGIDITESNVALVNKYAKEAGLRNVEAYHGTTTDWPENLYGMQSELTIVSEVLEHVAAPWEVTDALEGHTRIGGRLVLTVPQGPWEFQGLKGQQWFWRAHIWHVNKEMVRFMYGDKEGCSMSSMSENVYRDGRPLGHLQMGYTVDREPAHPVDPLWKASTGRYRQSIAACMIAMNDDDVITKCLNSIHQDVDIIQVALGPSNDHTRERLLEFAGEHPWIDFRIKDVPRIEAGVFGFDDARNASIEDIEADWILWIDSDEYLSGYGLQVYLRNNCFDSYAIHQHHFTCEPRGVPAQIDRPARLFRTGQGFKFFGKVHEHAEKGYNGGPGFVMVLPNIDIGHTGYINDMIRQERFRRNFPLLEWDRDVYPERKLGRYLWLRDYIHRMRMLDGMGEKLRARQLAEEAVDFYTEHAKDFEGVGAGSVSGNNALAYYGEALKYLGRGFPIAVQVQLEDQTAGYEGIFESAEEAVENATKGLAEEIRKRKTGYWA